MPSTTPDCPQVALMRAVLGDALSCLLRYRGRRLGREAEEWILSDEKAWPFSFVNICQVLDIDPGYIRHRLKRVKNTDAPTKFKRFRFRLAA